MRTIDKSIIGETFGKLLVLEHSHTKPGRSYWKCLCLLCQKTCLINRSNFTSGNTSSCGCQYGLRKKVATLTGYSPATVTFVLTKNPKRNAKLAKTTIRTIRKVAQQLGVQGEFYADIYR